MIDKADAQRFLIPAAALENAAGSSSSRPTPAMAAAVKDNDLNRDRHTLQTNYTTKDPAAYPLTMVIYAVVPTGGISRPRRRRSPSSWTSWPHRPEPAPPRASSPRATSRCLRACASRRSRPPPRSSTRSATPSRSRPRVRRHTSADRRPRRRRPHPGDTPHRPSIAVSFSSPDTTGMSWWLALLIAGGVLLISGPTALVLGSPEARGAISAGTAGSGRPHAEEQARRPPEQETEPGPMTAGTKAPVRPIRRRKS